MIPNRTNPSGRLLSINGRGGQPIDTYPWQALFDLSLEASGQSWTDVADLVQVARFGHFTAGMLPWEDLRFSSLPSAVAA